MAGTGTGSQGATVFMESDWTPERAAHLIRDLPARATRVLRHVVDGSGWADIDMLRGPNGDGVWKGLNTTLANAVARASRTTGDPVVREGAPVVHQDDPDLVHDRGEVVLGDETLPARGERP